LKKLFYHLKQSLIVSLWSSLIQLKPLWDALSQRRRRQLLLLQLLSLLAAAGEVANLGALLPFLRLLANPHEGLGIGAPGGTAAKSA